MTSGLSCCSDKHIATVYELGSGAGGDKMGVFFGVWPRRGRLQTPVSEYVRVCVCCVV